MLITKYFEFCDVCYRSVLFQSNLLSTTVQQKSSISDWYIMIKKDVSNAGTETNWFRLKPEYVDNICRQYCHYIKALPFNFLYCLLGFVSQK